MTLLQVVGEPIRGEVAHTSATVFSGYVKRLPQVKPDEKLVMSQVLVPPLASEYNTVKDAWMDQKLWKDDNFIEVLSEDCPAKVKAKVVEAIYEYLDLHMDPHIRDLKRRQDHNWKRVLVDSFGTSLRDPPVSCNVEKYTVPHTDPIQALRGQLGLRTVGASDVFVVGVYRCRTMLELPTYTEQERVSTPAGFQKSPYWWGLELDRYAVDGKLFQPSWMAQGHVCEKPPSKKKRKESAAKGGTGAATMTKGGTGAATMTKAGTGVVTVTQGQTSMWSAGYTMVHSAFGYGNETVLCNDPHALPYTSLDDTEAVEVAVQKSNISVKICRIGPWVFPVEVTTCFLPKGSPLLYFYGREYWVTNRASLALATLADAREGKLRRENEALQRRLHQMQQQHEQAARWLSLQADPGVFLKHDSLDTLTHNALGSAPCLRGINHSTRAVAPTVPDHSAKSNVGTSQLEFQNQNSPGNPAAAGRLDNALSINSGAAVGPAGDSPGLSGTALESVHVEVHDLRQILGTMLQRMSALEFNLQDIRHTRPGDQLQLNKDQDHLQSFFEHPDSNPQHAHPAINSAAMPLSANLPSRPGSRPGGHLSGVKGVQQAGGNQHSMQSMQVDLLAKPNPRQKLKARSKAVAAVQPDVEPLDSAPKQATDKHTQLVPCAGLVQEVECLAAASTPEPAAGLSQGQQVEASLASKKRKSSALLSGRTEGEAGPEAAQQLTADPAQKKKSKQKKKSEAAAAPSVAPDPALVPKKNRQTVKVVGAYAGQQPAGESAAQAEEDWCQDPGAVEEESMQWGRKQKRKRNRVAGLAPRLLLFGDQALETVTSAGNQVAAAVYDATGTQQRLHGQAAEALVRYTVPPLGQFSQAQAVAIDQELQRITGHDNWTHYSPAERETMGSLLKELKPGTVVCLRPPQVKQSLLTSFYSGRNSQPASVGHISPTAAVAAANAEAGGGSPAASDSTTATTPQSSGHHAEAAAKGNAEHSSVVVMLADDAEGLAGGATPLVDSVLWAPSRQGTSSSSHVSSTALATVQERPVPPQIMGKFATAAAAVATATAAADANDLDTLAEGPTAGLPAFNPDNCRSDKLAEHKGRLQEGSTCEDGDEGLAGSGLAAQLAEDADEKVLEEESEHVGVTEGAANSHDATSCLNTTKTRFIVLEDGKIDVNPDEMEPRLVRRRIVGEDDEHGSCYLIARDILKACGPIMSNTGRTIRRWIKRAKKHSAAELPRQAYWSGASNCTFVFGARDIQTLMLPSVLSDTQRDALQRFIEGMWAGEEEGSPQADEEEGLSHADEEEGSPEAMDSPAASIEVVLRADSSSPAPASTSCCPASRACGSSPKPAASPDRTGGAAADRAVPRSPDNNRVLQGRWR
ncbi:TPA: hypothetical protein ACH3X1_005123 [Trebouxia sp. C0004]